MGVSDAFLERAISQLNHYFAELRKTTKIETILNYKDFLHHQLQQYILMPPAEQIPKKQTKPAAISQANMPDIGKMGTWQKYF